MTGAPGKYAFYLSSRSARYVAVWGYPAADATRQERLEAVEGCAAALAGVAATAPKDAVGFHVSGMRNAQQFLAMACEELVWLSGRPHPAATRWGEPPKPDQRSEIPLEFGRDPATGEWRAIRWVT
jgi:hypothetical protein